MKLALAAAVAALTAGLALAAAAQPASDRACFQTRDMRNHTVGDDHTLYVKVGQRDVYRIGMTNSCLAGAMSSDPIIMRSPPGSTTVCKPIDLDISITRGGGHINTPCIVGSLMKLTPQEAAALPRKVRP
jgi:hypothetical protein